MFLATCSAPTAAWDETGHVIVTRLAWEKLPPEMPDWLRTPKARERLEYLCAEPDRWRGQHNVHLDHVNNPEHYIDAEELKNCGLSLGSLPPLRRQFLDALAKSRLDHPEKYNWYRPNRDKEYTRLVPGVLPYTIAELQWKLAASWTTLRTYEEYRDYVTDAMIDNARQNVLYEMGILSHYVGDGAQPLHLTVHHHGWKGPNPKGYTTDRDFHSYIDGDVIVLHGLTPDNMAALAAAPRTISKEEYWADIGRYLSQTYSLVEPLYALEKSGDLKKAPGKKFIQDRLITAGSMLAGIWTAAYHAAVIDDFRVQQLTGKPPIRSNGN